MKAVYMGGFSDWDDVANNFRTDPYYPEVGKPIELPDGAEVLFAYYDIQDWSGDAFVLYRQDGKLYEVNGSHCSCYGLEGQWQPEDTSIEALRERTLGGFDRWESKQNPNYNHEPTTALRHVLDLLVLDEAMANA